jgi:HD-like signal output (HDOD) protein
LGAGIHGVRILTQAVAQIADMQSMEPSPVEKLEHAENCDFVHGLLEKRLAREEIELPLLPEVAVRVMRISTQRAGGAEQLSAIINADPALTAHVMRLAASAANRPATLVSSLHRAVAWLGFDAVANIVFTLALQGRMLNVPGQNQKARRLWRHSLASALWAQHLGHMLASDAGETYLCGLLHSIGKPVALGAVHDIAQRAQVRLSSEEFDRLIETFHRGIGALVVSAWGLPNAVYAAVTQWEAYEAAGEMRRQCHIVNIAHHLADFTLAGTMPLARELFADSPTYAALGLTEVDSIALFDAAVSINTDLDTYLPP